MGSLVDANGNPVEETTTEQEAVDSDVAVEATTEGVVQEEAIAVEEQAEPTPEEKVAERKALGKQIIDECEYGYMVGISAEGKLTYQEVGSKQGYVQVLGLHEFAKQRLQVMSDTNLQYGAALVSTQVNQIGQMIQQMGELLKVLLNMQTNASKNQILGAMKR